MKRIISLLTSLPILLCCLAMLLFAITHTGCNNATDKNTKLVTGTSALSPPGTDTPWLLLNIRFKSTVNEETRQVCIKAIEAYLIDTITDMRNYNFPNYRPSISVKKYPFEDSISYQFKITGRNDQAFAIAKVDTAIAPGSGPPCKCPSCGVCFAIKDKYVTPVPVGPSVPMSQLMDLVETP
jgi:hypothetical protein